MKRRISRQLCWTITSSSESVTRLSSHGRIGGRRGHLVEMAADMRGGRLAEHEAFEQRVGGEAVGAVQPRLRAFARRIEAGQIGAALEIDDDAAAGIMLRGHDRDRLRA